jgi:transaldolase / glucose-6-phosphate isomerase
MSNPLLKVQGLGQSIWLDFIRRSILISGELKKLINDDGLRGVTSNPAIFVKAIDGSDDYSAAVRGLRLEGKTVEEIYSGLTTADIRQPADLFRPVYEDLDGRDGFVSLEVSPLLARNTQETIEEARSLWSALDRPNVFIKVPATKEGLAAIRQLTSEGINVNVTLLFGLDRYKEVTEAYISGLEAALKAGKTISRTASVASFFLSRIDVLVDPFLKEQIEAGADKVDIAKQLTGETAIACAKTAYQMYKNIFSGDRWKRLEDKGARKQRLLWASTGTKNPDYPDLKYVEPLIGPETINTLPMETLNAYRDHGDPKPGLEHDLDKSQQVLNQLSQLGIDLKKMSDQLEDEGIEKFKKPYEKFMSALERKTKEALSESRPSGASANKLF